MQCYSHIAIGVRDMDRSLRFYCGLLGLRVHRDMIETLPEMGVKLEPIQKDVDEGDSGPQRLTQRRAVLLRWRDDDPGFMVLSQRSTPAGAPLDFDEVGIHHFGFRVNNIDELSAGLKAAGVTFLVDNAIGDGEFYAMEPGHKVKTCIFSDPDGTLIQLDQIVE